MPLNLPYQISGQILDSSSTALPDVRVFLRNETTNSTITTTADSDGRYLEDAANIGDGYAIGDVILAFVIYRDQSGRGTHTIQSAGGGGTIDITLVTAPSAPTLRYFTVQEFYDLIGAGANDAEVIDPLQIARVGEDIENEIDNLTGSKFDSGTSSAYYANPSNTSVSLGFNNTGFEYHDAKGDNWKDYFLRYTPIREVLKFETNTSSDDTSPSWTDLATIQLDNMDATTGWTGTSGGTDTITLSLNEDPDNLIEGNAAMFAAKSGTNNDTVTLTKTFSPTRDFTNNQIRFNLYVDAVGDFPAAGTTALEVRYGNDSSNYYSKTYDRTSFNAGSYTTLTIGLGDSGISDTGNPDKTTCDYFALVFTLNAASTTLTAGDVRLDDIRINEEDKLDIDNETGRITIVNTADFPSKGRNQIRVKYLYGRSSIPNDIRTLSILMTARQLTQGAILKALMAGRSEFDLRDGMRQVDMQIDRILSRYRNRTIINV